jgi:hypothetical protein
VEEEETEEDEEEKQNWIIKVAGWRRGYRERLRREAELDYRSSRCKRKRRQRKMKKRSRTGLQK